MTGLELPHHPLVAPLSRALSARKQGLAGWGHMLDIQSRPRQTAAWKANSLQPHELANVIQALESVHHGKCRVISLISLCDYPQQVTCSQRFMEDD